LSAVFCRRTSGIEPEAGGRLNSPRQRNRKRQIETFGGRGLHHGREARNAASRNRTRTCPQNTDGRRRRFLHPQRRTLFRINPWELIPRSQTLLSRRTRTRQGENFLFRQAAFAWQAVESRQRAIHFVIRRKKICIDALDLLIGQPLDFFDDLSCVHVSSVISAAKKSEQEMTHGARDFPRRLLEPPEG
jgi:hypothetical protein